MANVKQLASKIAARTPDQRAGVMAHLAPKFLTPQQLGRLHVAVDALLKAPQRRQEAADLAGAGYMRGADGKLYLTPRHAAQACFDYHKMMRSNTQVSDVVSYGSSTATGVALGWHALDAAMSSVLGKSLGVMGAIASVTTQTLAHAPPPPGCP